MNKKEVKSLLEEKKSIRLDIACGDSKQSPDWVGIDILPLPGVDIVHNLEQFPWPLPDKCISISVASHILEHINPSMPDARFVPLINLLIKKKLITNKEIEEHIGEVNPGPIFKRFMNEVWRITKEGGQFMLAIPYAGSPGMNQDPTHVNSINEVTWFYFDPLHYSNLYRFYRPAPWKILNITWSPIGNLEVALEKMSIDKSYGFNEKELYGKKK